MQSVCAPSSGLFRGWQGKLMDPGGCAKGWLAVRGSCHLLCVSPSSHTNVELLFCLQVVPFPSDCRVEMSGSIQSPSGLLQGRNHLGEPRVGFAEEKTEAQRAGILWKFLEKTVGFVTP